MDGAAAAQRAASAVMASTGKWEDGAGVAVSRGWHEDRSNAAPARHRLNSALIGCLRLHNFPDAFRIFDNYEARVALWVFRAGRIAEQI